LNFQLPGFAVSRNVTRIFALRRLSESAAELRSSGSNHLDAGILWRD
jgi:hypothetical protein